MSKSKEALEYLRMRLSSFKDEVDIKLIEDQGRRIIVEIAYPLNLEAIVRGIVGYAVYDALMLYDVHIKPIFKIKPHS